MDTSNELQKLHSAYCAITGLEIRWNPMVLEHLWFDWWHEGNTEEDLRLTVAYLSKLYAKRPDILAACLRLRRLIGDTLFFSQMCAEAKKVVRVKEQHAAKESVLRATGRVVEQPKDAQPVSRILDSQAFKELVKLKETLK